MKYRIVRNGLGEYAVAEVQHVVSRRGMSEVDVIIMSGFSSEKDARNWLEAHEKRNTWEVV